MGGLVRNLLHQVVTNFGRCRDYLRGKPSGGFWPDCWMLAIRMNAFPLACDQAALLPLAKSYLGSTITSRTGLGSIRSTAMLRNGPRIATTKRYNEDTPTDSSPSLEGDCSRRMLQGWNGAARTQRSGYRSDGIVVRTLAAPQGTSSQHVVPGSSEPVMEARCDSSIQLPSGSRTIETRAVVPSVIGARASRPPWAST